MFLSSSIITFDSLINFNDYNKNLYLLNSLFLSEIDGFYFISLSFKNHLNVFYKILFEMKILPNILL
jgi:hypothetical protein